MFGAKGLEPTATRIGSAPWLTALVASRLGVLLGLFGAPVLGLPALNLPGFVGHAFSAAPAAVAAGWLVFAAIGGIWTWVFTRLAPSLGRGPAAALTALINWAVCGILVLPTAVYWGPRVAAGLIPAPGFFGVGWKAGVPWTLLLAFALSAPGLTLAIPEGAAP